MIVLYSPVKIALRRAIALTSEGLACRRTLRISLLPGTDGTGRVFVCLSVREHWSSHWAGAIEHSTLLHHCIETYLCVARVSCTHVHVRTVYVAIASTCPRVCTYESSPSQEGVLAETLP